MADGENILVGASSSTSNIEEPVSKKAKMSMAIECGLKIVQTEQVTYGPEAGESWAAAMCALPEEKEIEPVMSVGQASAAAPGGDNGLLVFEPRESGVTLDKASGPTADFLAHSTVDDDRSSHASSSDWTPQPQIGSYSFIQQHIMRETDPRTILKDLLPPETVLPPDLDDMTLWQIIINISEPPKRKKRKDINTLEDVVRVLHESRKILVLTGAGVSVSCGIPDFRSRDGIYARLAIDFPDLPDPQAMFDIEYFRRDPRPFFKFAKEIYPGQFQPSPCHKFISMLGKHGKLLRNYTQNIDTLEQVAGVQRIIQCHGTYLASSLLNYIPLAIMKPDIVFFGENLPELFHRAMKQDKDEVDLLIVIGSSLKVRPVALIPTSIPHEVPQVLINREQLPHLNFDVELLGDCDVIVNELCHRLGGDFEQLCYNSLRLSEITEKPLRSQTLAEQAPCEALSTHSKPTEEEQKHRHTDSSVGASEETDTHMVTDTPEGDSAPEEPCPKTQSPNEKRMENSDSPSADTRSEEPSGLNDQHVNLEVRRRCWMSRISRSPISKRLETSQYLFQAPNHYIFHGAEVYSNSEDETSSSCGSNSEDSSLEEEEDDDDEEEDSDAEEDQSTPAEEGKGCLIDIVTHKQACEGTSSVKQMESTDKNVRNTTDL
uniref:protein acetyllysine N-acetyltransferase n=1 Tax=Hucho hucho TaxID=62062 RepID=A0A4W5NW56_9TELE